MIREKTEIFFMGEPQHVIEPLVGDDSFAV